MGVHNDLPRVLAVGIAAIRGGVFGVGVSLKARPGGVWHGGREGGRRGEGDVGRGRAVSLILCNRVGNSTSSYERAE